LAPLLLRKGEEDWAMKKIAPIIPIALPVVTYSCASEDYNTQRGAAVNAMGGTGVPGSRQKGQRVLALEVRVPVNP